MLMNMCALNAPWMMPARCASSLSACETEIAPGGLICNDSGCEVEFESCDGEDTCGRNEICSRGQCIEFMEDENCDGGQTYVSDLCEETCQYT